MPIESKKRARWQKNGAVDLNQTFTAGEHQRKESSLLGNRKPDQLDLNMLRVSDAEAAKALKRMDFKCEWDLPRFINLEAVEPDRRSMAIDTPNIGFFRKIKQ